MTEEVRQKEITLSLCLSMQEKDVDYICRSVTEVLSENKTAGN